MRRLRKLLLVLADRPVLSSVLACIAFSLISLWHGQDSSWDVRNYHIYDAYAVLHSRIGFDMAPAGFQSYFNPLLDIPYFWMITHWPAPLAGLVLGAWGGLTYGLLYLIAYGVLIENDDVERRQLASGLALAGALSVNIVFWIGSATGDVTTTILVLAAFAIVIATWSRQLRGEIPIFLLLLAGVLAGAAAGLKLTNAPYALALGLSMAIAPGSPRRKVMALISVCSGVALGLAVSIGWWWWLMFEKFGNPLFPQFSAWFPNGWSLPISIGDRRFLPRNFWEALIWPVILTINGSRVADTGPHQPLWIVVYLLYIVWLTRAVVGAVRRRKVRGELGAAHRDASASEFLLVLIGVSFLVWMKVFSIYRYTTPIAVLLPLAAWILWNQHTARKFNKRIMAWVIGLATAFGLFAGNHDIGHDSWTYQALRITTPQLQSPNTSTVLLVTAPALSYPIAWLVTGFPQSLMFASVGSDFPASEGYWKTLRDRIRRRGGNIYAIFAAPSDGRGRDVRLANVWIDKLHLNSSTRGCGALRAIVARTHVHAVVIGPREDHPPNMRCSLGETAADKMAVQVANARHIRRASRVLAGKGYRLEANSCKRFNAQIGAGDYSYSWCRVEPSSVASVNRPTESQASRTLRILCDNSATSCCKNGASERHREARRTYRKSAHERERALGLGEHQPDR